MKVTQKNYKSSKRLNLKNNCVVNLFKYSFIPKYTIICGQPWVDGNKKIYFEINTSRKVGDFLFFNIEQLGDDWLGYENIVESIFSLNLIEGLCYKRLLVSAYKPPKIFLTEIGIEKLIHMADRSDTVELINMFRDVKSRI